MDEPVGEELGVACSGEGGRRRCGGGLWGAGAYRLRGGCTGSNSGWETRLGEPGRETGLCGG